jgi:hypothetical protein
VRPAKLLLFTLLVSCSSKIGNIKTVFRSTDIPIEEQAGARYLKLHLANGDLVFFNNWSLDSQTETISGSGFAYGPNRSNRKQVPAYTIPLEECILAETNDPQGVNVLSPIIMTFPVILGVATVPCLFDPKACFGSCPTFYTILEDDSLLIQAEGFSSSITESLEAKDVDQLRADNTDDIFSLVIKNEAYETHYVRRADVLAFPIDEGNHVLHSEEGFFEVSNIYRVEDVLNPIYDRDAVEYFSESDANDLTEKETLIIDFESRDASELGIVITERQSLLTTFLFYQSIAYMGSRAGDLLARYESEMQKNHEVPVPIMEMLGGIEVSARVDGKWYDIGELNESGPIVSDTHLIRLNVQGQIDQVSLTMTKGLWRVDEVALAEVGEELAPVRIAPFELVENGAPRNDLLEKLNSPDEYLVNLPGSNYTMNYTMPDAPNLQLFLETQGYYIEWMREDWLMEEDRAMTRMMFLRPQKWLSEMAPKYKLVEPVMEELFWSSKFVAP